MKKCKKCGLLLPLEGFHKDGKNKDGRKNICKKCRSVRKEEKISKNRKRFDSNIKHQIYMSIKQNKSGKSWEKFLGFTLKELKKHLEDQFDENMSWDNYGSYWWIDKIIPCSKYRYSTYGEFQKSWSLKNIRPLYKKTCQKKSNKIYLQLIEKYSLYDLLPIGALDLEKGEIE